MFIGNKLMIEYTHFQECHKLNMMSLIKMGVVEELLY